MTTSAFQRPIIGATGDPFWRRINTRWLIPRAPSVILATLSSFGVGGFIQQSGKTPSINLFGALTFDPIAILGAFAFDAVIIGTIALGDQHFTTDKTTQRLYYALNIGATFVAALFNTLYYAGGEYGRINAEALTHGVFFAIFGLLYSLYYAAIMRPILKREHDEAEIKRQLREADENRMRARLLANPFECKYQCGERFASAKQRAGHYAQCVKRPPKP